MGARDEGQAAVRGAEFPGVDLDFSKGCRAISGLAWNSLRRMRSGRSSQDFALGRNRFSAFFRLFSPFQRRKSREKTMKKREKRRKICAGIEENQSFMPYSAGSPKKVILMSFQLYLSDRRAWLGVSKDGPRIAARRSAPLSMRGGVEGSTIPFRR